MYWKFNIFCTTFDEDDSDGASDDEDDDLLADGEGIPEDDSEDVEQEE